MSRRRSGLSNDRKAYSCKPKHVCNSTSIQVSDYLTNAPMEGYTQYTFGFALTWDPINNGTVYLISQPGVAEQAFKLVTPTSGYYYTNDDASLIYVYARVCGCPNISGSVGPCFFHDAIVSMADGSTKAIEDVRIGDMVLGAFGEHNEVLALHRPLLGNNTMTNINNNHHTSSHHPHISPDKKFYAVKPAVVMTDTYGKSHEVLDENMVPYHRFLSGLKPGRVQQMELGLQLKTIDGTREVIFLDTYEMAPETQLYNLVLGGSHTYYVDGYAVTGWPNEEDFDYDAWA
jgi:hypothetical protein